MAQRTLGGLDDLSKQLLVALLSKDERISEILQCHKRRVIERISRCPPKMTHMPARPKRESEVVTQLSNVGAAFALHPDERLAIVEID